jgi:uncharacterized protein (DUF342 family)
LKILRALFIDVTAREEIQNLQKQLKESEKRIEKLTSMTDNLIKLGDSMARDIMTLASHTALIEMTMSESQDCGKVFLKKPSDDNLIN